MLKNCQFCKKEFNAESEKTKVCSLSCASNLRWRGVKKVDYTKECKNCKCLYESRNIQKVFCSDSCRKEFQLERKLKFTCECCGVEFSMREVTYIARGKVARFCNSECQRIFLRNENSPAYKGGQYVSEEFGEVMVLVESKDTKLNKNNVYRALKRIVAEQKIGRKLDKSECVIHVDGNKLNNNPENLFICGIGLTRSIFYYKTQPLPKESNLNSYK
jgi:hypothetical protein